MNNGWIGVDLDGTLAMYDKWRGIEHIGEPVPIMLKRVKQWIKEGKRVKIFTARICDGKVETQEVITKWLIKNLGFALEVTNVKDYGMIELWDDRAVQVIPNTGYSIEERNFMISASEDRYSPICSGCCGAGCWMCETEE